MTARTVRFAALLIAILAIVSLAACGGNNGSTSGSDAPSITELTALPSTLNPGDVSILQWSVTGSGDITLALDPDGIDVSGATSRAVSPTETTTYTLTATSELGSSTERVVVYVGDAPTIEDISASPPEVAPGETSTLAWSVIGDGSISLSIDQGVGDVTGESSASVSPTETTTYELTAMSEFGSATQAVSVDVSDTQAPEITSVSAEPGDGYIQLSWELKGTTSEFEIYREEVSTSSLTAQALELIATVDGDARQYSDVDVSPEASYEYAVAVAGGEPVRSSGGAVSPDSSNTLRVVFGTAVPAGTSVQILSDPPGIDCGSAGALGCTATFTSTSNVTLTVETSGGVATTWDGCDVVTSGACTVDLDTDRTVTVSFETLNTLAVEVTEPGNGRVTSVNDLGPNPSIDCTGSCSYDYPQDLVIGLSADPVDPGTHEFDAWSGACSGATGSTCTVTMDSSKSVAASFRSISP